LVNLITNFIAMFTTPILVIIFNRPDFAKNIFLALSEIKPSRLYVVSDGPRTKSEESDIQESRELFNSIDWKCEVSYDYSDVNMGLRKRISSAISWAFESEEKLIILEDDCIPHPDFFKFCGDLLIKYKDDKRVMCINGCNLNPQLCENYSETYFFSRYSNSWGWATWKRAWDLFDSELAGLDDKRIYKTFADNLPRKYRSKTYWSYMLGRVKQNKIDSWAYRWMFSLWINNGLAIVPQSNLIQNIGNDHRSTHTKGHLHYINIKTSTLKLNNFQAPEHLIPNTCYDNWLEDSVYSKTTINRMIWVAKRIRSAFQNYKQTHFKV
jgi:hypothetical protein